MRARPLLRALLRFFYAPANADHQIGSHLVGGPNIVYGNFSGADAGRLEVRAVGRGFVSRSSLRREVCEACQAIDQSGFGLVSVVFADCG